MAQETAKIGDKTAQKGGQIVADGVLTDILTVKTDINGAGNRPKISVFYNKPIKMAVYGDQKYRFSLKK